MLRKTQLTISQLEECLNFLEKIVNGNGNENDYSADKGGTLGVAGKKNHGKDVIFPSGQK